MCFLRFDIFYNNCKLLLAGLEVFYNFVTSLLQVYYKNTNMAEAANSVELLFSTLNSVEWTKAPYRGMIARIGKEFYPNDKYPGIRTWRQIFQLRNLTMALRLKEEYDSIQTLAKKALQNSSTNASQNG